MQQHLQPACLQQTVLVSRQPAEVQTAAAAGLAATAAVKWEDAGAAAVVEGSTAAGSTAVAVGSAPERACACCGKEGVKLQRCAGCSTVLYCSEECHRTHWQQGKHHRASRALQAAAGLARGAKTSAAAAPAGGVSSGEVAVAPVTSAAPAVGSDVAAAVQAADSTAAANTHASTLSAHAAHLDQYPSQANC